MSDSLEPQDIDRAERGRQSQQAGDSFEQRVAELYRLLQYDVQHGRIFSGRQVDLFLSGRFGDLAVHRAIECKVGAVTTTHLDEFLAKLVLVKREYPAALGTLVSSVSFTDAVTAHAVAVGVQLTLYRDLSAKLLDGERYAQGLLRDGEADPGYSPALWVEPLVGPDLNGPATEALRYVQDWLEDSQWSQLTLLGDVGTGKSFLARMIAKRLATEFLERPVARPLPVLIDLKNADRHFSLEGLVLTHFSQKGMTNVSFEAFEHALSAGQVVVIFDGFDEMAARVTPQVTNRNFHELARCVRGAAKVLLTCRTHYFTSRTDEEQVILGNSGEYGSDAARELYHDLIARNGFSIAYLRPFDLGHIDAYVRRAQPNGAEKAMERIRRTYDLLELSHRPLMLDMIVRSLDRLDGSDVNPATLYEIYTDAWIHRDRWRDVLAPAEKRRLLTSLACTLWRDDASSIHYSELAEYVGDRVTADARDPHMLLAIDSEIRTASFLTRDARGNYRFIHKSHGEYFVARSVADGLHRGDVDVLSTRRFTPEVIGFLRYMLSEQEAEHLLAETLLSPYRQLVSENALLCLYGIRRFKALADRTADDLVAPTVALPKHMNLRGALLDQVTLEGADLSDVDLSDAQLAHSILSGANLARALLIGSRLDKALLSDCILTDAVLTDATAVGVNLERAELSRAVLTRTNLTEAYMQGVSCLDANFAGAALAGATLPATLAEQLGVDPREVRLSWAVSPSSHSETSDALWSRITQLRPWLMRTAQRFAEGRVDADDVVSDVLLRILARPPNIDTAAHDSLHRYLTGAVITATRNRTRSVLGRGESSIDDADDVHFMRDGYDALIEFPNTLDAMIERERTIALLRVMSRVLSPESLRLVRRRHVDGATLKQIGDECGLPASTVHRRIVKALELVRLALIEQGGA